MTGKSLCILASIAMLVGCAQLHVDVDIYRGPIPVSADAARKAAVAAMAGTSEQAVADFRTSVFKNVEGVVTRDFERAASNVLLAWNGDSKRPGTGIKAILESAWLPVARAAQGVYSLANQALANTSSDVSGAAQLYNAKRIEQIRSASAKLDFEWQSFKSSVDTAVGTELTHPSSLQELNAVLAQSHFGVPGIAASDAVAGRFAGSPVFDTRISALSQDPNDWTSFGSNQFEARGGTSQFVVVREGLVVYHQKSLDFDPTPAVGAGAAVTRLGLKVGAALVTGVASPSTPATSETGAAQASTLFDADAAERNRELIERTRRAREQLLGALATLLDQSKQAGASASTLKARLQGEINYFLGRTANVGSTKE